MFVGIPYINIDGVLELTSNLSGYEVVFLEVLTGHTTIYSAKLEKIESVYGECGKESLLHIVKLCFKICNEEDSESKMVTMLKEHDELIRERLGDWLCDPKSKETFNLSIP
ncbi:hypothetical protein HanPI659440_Chr09g0319921 [Helianthus annuus]|nr:hypothetical protein HanPI659440_Chr09g0319921 [Helianthus annuus]